MRPRPVMTRARSNDAAPADDPEQDDDDGNHDEDVDEPAQRVGSDQPQKPQDDQNDGNGVQHREDLLELGGFAGAGITS